MRFAAWPAVYLLALVPALLLLYAYALRRRREALSTLVARDLAPRLLRLPMSGARGCGCCAWSGRSPLWSSR